MRPYKLGKMEQKLADLIWQHEPLSSRTLTELCADAFNWKRTTTYTMLRRLVERGIFQNDGGTVSALMTKSEFGAAQGEEFLNNSFGGSLPKFLAAFTQRKRLNEKEINEILRLITEHKEGR